MRSGMRLIGVFAALMVLAALGLAQYSSLVYRPEGGATLEVASGGAVNVQSGGAVNVAAGGALVNAGQAVLTTSAIDLTSPTVTFSAAGKGLVSLTANANLTGVRPTGGTLGQVLTVLSGAGSNTMRFDDNSTSMTIGGNVTLTEAQGDTLQLLCTNAEGDEWAKLAGSDN